MIAAGAAFSVCSAARASASIDSMRLGARDVEATVRFYEQAFGLREKGRVRGGVEVLLGFGDAKSGSSANPGPLILIMKRETDTPQDAMAHLILRVTDIAAFAAQYRGTLVTFDRALANRGTKCLALG